MSGPTILVVEGNPITRKMVRAPGVSRSMIDLQLKEHRAGQGHKEASGE